MQAHYVAAAPRLFSTCCGAAAVPVPTKSLCTRYRFHQISQTRPNTPESPNHLSLFTRRLVLKLAPRRNGGSVCAHGNPRSLRHIRRGTDFTTAALYMYATHAAPMWNDADTSGAVQACDPQNFEPNLALNLEITDLINSKKGTA